MKRVPNKVEYRQEKFIRFIIDGKREFTEEEIEIRKDILGLGKLNPPFVVVVISPDYTSVEFQEKDLLQEECENYIRKLFAKYGVEAYLYTDTCNNIVCLISLSNCSFKTEDLDLIFVNIRERVFRKLCLETYIGIGSIVRSYSKIASSFSEAYEMLGYKYHYANNGVVNIANLVKFQCNTSLENRVVFDRVVGCFQDGNLGKMSVRLEELVEQVRHRPNVSKTSIKRTMVELIVHILHVASNANVDVDAVLGDIDPYRWVMSQNHTEIITEWIMQISSDLLEAMKSKKENSEIKVVQQAKAFIEDQLSDWNLGLQQICENVNLSNAYFSQLFKKETGIGVNAYIVQSRIERAKELLKETNLKCAEVACQTGFSSSGYFVQVFKKNAGMTPGEFRKIHRNEKN